MVEIILIRHGLTLWNRAARIQGISDVELSEEGLRQAELLAKNFPFDKVDAVYSSDLSRAKTTAKFVADKFNLPVQTTAELREVDFGIWEGKYFSELEKFDADNLKTFYKNPDELKLDRAETFQQAQSRAMNAIKKIIANHESDGDSRIVAVAHGSINRTILCAILDIPLKNMWRLSQFNTAINILRVDDGNFTVQLLNSTAHIDLEKFLP